MKEGLINEKYMDIKGLIVNCDSDLFDGVEALVTAWKQGLEVLEANHPRVFKKVQRNIIEYVKKKYKYDVDFENALYDLAYELLREREKKPQLLSVKIALTCRKYLYNYYGSGVKFYHDGSVEYRDRNTWNTYRFVIHSGERIF